MNFTNISDSDRLSILQKGRRFSVHNVDENEVAVHYGQPENNDIDDQLQIIKVLSNEDYIDDDDIPFQDNGKRLRSLTVEHHSLSLSDSISDAVIIQNTLDDDYFDMDDEDDLYTDSRDHTPSQSHTYDKELTPENNAQIFNAAVLIDINEDSKDNSVVGDSMESADADTGHERYSSTIIHSATSSATRQSSQLPIAMGIVASEGRNVPMCAQKDYWCHVSEAIALDEQGGNPLNEIEMKSPDVHRSYTRPLICKVNRNHEWSSAFGNGIVSHMHSKYLSKQNGSHIEWVIEVMHCATADSGNGSIMIGVSSDLMANNKENNFAFNDNGYAFDSCGNIIHNNEISFNAKQLVFNENENKNHIIHIILDYSSEHKWQLYANVGDVDDSSHQEQYTLLFDDLPPRSYRLAVALYSVDDALVIERCAIHGTLDGEFYQELKSYKKYSYDITMEDELHTNSNPNSNPNSAEVEENGDNGNVDAYIDRHDGKVVEVEVEVAVENLSDNEFENEDEKAIIEQPEITIGNTMSILENTEGNILTDEETNGRNDNSDKESMLQMIENNKILQKQSKDRLNIITELKNELLKIENESKEELNINKENEYLQTIEDLEQVIITLNENISNSSTPINIPIFQTMKSEKLSESKLLEIKCQEMQEENERLLHELQLAQERAISFEQHQLLLRQQLEDCIKSKMNLIQSTSAEINRYRVLINEVAQKQTYIVIGSKKKQYSLKH